MDAVGNLFRALRSRNYRLFLAGETVSMIGTWMQAVVQAWLVYRLSSSALWLGLIAFCSQFTAFLVSPLAGVLADELDRRKLLIWVGVAGLLQALTLAALFFTGHIELWHIAALSVVLGICNSFEIITRHSFAIDLVGKADLASAISLNSIVINGSRVAGPALGGVLIAWMNEGWCFLLNGLSYLAVVASLLAMDLAPRLRAAAAARPPILANFSQALTYLRAVPGITRLMVLSTFISFVGFPAGNLMPVFAKEVLRGDATTLASLSAMTGIGAVSGAILISSWNTRSGSNGRIRRTLTLCTLMIGASLAVLGQSRHLLLSTAACGAMGFFMMGAMPTINTRIQQLVDDRMRGRVLGVYTMTFLGATPLGSLLQGWAADRLGAGTVTTIAGAAFAALAAWLWVDARRGKG